MVVTSFPKELTEAYKKAFEAKNPGIKVEILNKPTPAGVAYIREAPASNKPDVFWVSAPDAFAVLSAEKLLAKIESPAKEVPAKIGNYPINDPKGFYLGQALAGYGIMWNTRYMKAHKLPDPKEWADLTKPVYFSHVAMSSPSRSGTTHLTVETMLQGEGWDKGWRQMLMIAGNCAAITERSFGVPDGVNNGQYGIGLVIDFFGLAGKASQISGRVRLSVGDRHRARQHRHGGQREERRQRAQIHQLHAVAGRPGTAVRSADQPPAGAAQHLQKSAAGISQSVHRHHQAQGEFRFRPVGIALLRGEFDLRPDHHVPPQGIDAGRHRRSTTRPPSSPAKTIRSATKLLDDARDAAYSPVVTEQKSKDKEFLALYRNTKRDAEKTKQTTALEEYWSNTARKNYLRAAELAKEAAALAK